MITYEPACNECAECVHCHLSGKVYPVLMCDCCKDYADKLYEYDGNQFCEDCLLKQFYTVTADELSNK